MFPFLDLQENAQVQRFLFENQVMVTHCCCHVDGGEEEIHFVNPAAQLTGVIYCNCGFFFIKIDEDDQLCASGIFADLHTISLIDIMSTELCLFI